MIGASAAGSSGGSAATSAAVRTGCATTGPVPGTISTSIPASLSGTTMSLNRIAASTRCRRTGCRVISVARSGVRQASSMPVAPRTVRYSGSDRPACRMNHTGRVGRPLAAVGGQQRGAGGAAVADRVGRRQAVGLRRVRLTAAGGGGGGDGHGRSMVSLAALGGHMGSRRSVPSRRHRRRPTATGWQHSLPASRLRGQVGRPAGQRLRCRRGEAYLRTASECPTGNIHAMLMVLGASHHDLELTQLDRLTGDPDLLSRRGG